jgi:non-ribosomal peptide synthetase component E (peptide arylation enzyme)
MSPHDVFRNMATMKSPGTKNTPFAQSQTLAMVTFESAGITSSSTSGTPKLMMRRHAAYPLMMINVAAL